MISEQYQQILYLYSYAIFEELSRLGVRRIVISPGARSTPLTVVAAMMKKFHLAVAYDERGAGYMALGMAKVSGKPVALICTSGTAVANYLPAVVEARMSGVPLILLTADRPAELRETGANQTIVQPGIFSHYVKWMLDLPVPSKHTRGESILKMIDHAFYRAMENPPGPVHLNCQFRKPLEPIPVTDENTLKKFFPIEWLNHTQPRSSREFETISSDEKPIEPILGVVREAKRPFIYISDLKIPNLVLQGSSDNIPFALDSTQSGLMKGEGFFPFLDLALLNSGFQKSFKPDIWIQLGSRPTSTRIENFLKQSSFKEYIHASVLDLPGDPAKKVTRRYVMKNEILFNMIEQLFSVQADSKWVRWLQGVKKEIQRIIEEFLEQETRLNQWQVMAVIRDLVPESHQIFLGNSMAVRLPDILGLQSVPQSVLTNRGASGIDGNIATIAGISAASQIPVTAVLGDLAFHHDMNSLELLRYASEKVILIVLNNHGGGIFHMLPVSANKSIFEPYFGTPHTYHFENIARHFQLDYYRVDEDIKQFKNAYQQALNNQRHTLIEVELDRYYDKELFDKLAGKIRSLSIQEAL